ncbi:uncharacterized protein A1O5_02785 [Cladophialophora psammophila CBS 110553]|uniref:Uncharacterized protein n=1 Tax=Cladophialophora psammophila CBS 110553 TaxID=1182543 RepID=W9XW63_9EURO|nr:uncharacterized protein A1O5_02785 [Cladophialophora psammophila CBS 110553]EXJ74489.1 hypothetical protein A1O5_02785 [Cladophialophora psammophila CBS 110553]
MVQFQSCQRYEGVREHGALPVALVQYGDEVILADGIPELLLRTDVIVALPSPVAVELPGDISVLDVIALVIGEEIDPTEDHPDELPADGVKTEDVNDSDAGPGTGCDSELLVDAEFEMAETRDELEGDIVEANG